MQGNLVDNQPTDGEAQSDDDSNYENGLVRLGLMGESRTVIPSWSFHQEELGEESHQNKDEGE